MQSVEEWLKNKNALAVPTVSGLQPVSQWAKTRPIQPTISEKFAATLPGTTQVLAELQTDPLSFKADSRNWLNAAVTAVRDTISTEGKNVEDYLTRTFITEKDKPILEKVGEGLQVGGRAVISSVFAPITALFAGAKEVPALGTLARLIEVPFIAAGEGGATATSALIDKSPLPQNVKDDIKPGLTDLAALIAQLAIGKVGLERANLLKNKKTELTKKYGEQEANTIVEKAQEIVGKQAEVKAPAPEGKMSVAEWQAAGKPKEIAPVVERPVEVITTPEVKPAVETVTVPRSQLPVGEGELRLSRLEARIKEQLEAVPKEIQDTLTTYSQMNKTEQIKGASEYVTRNPEEALAVLRGDIPAPKGLLHNSIGLALEQVAKGNQDLAIKLTSLRSTRAGQEISILTERDPLSPVKYMSEIADRRIEIKGGREQLAKVRNTETVNIKKSISKSNLAKTDWNTFIDSITC